MLPHVQITRVFYLHRLMVSVARCRSFRLLHAHYSDVICETLANEEAETVTRLFTPLSLYQAVHHEFTAQFSFVVNFWQAANPHQHLIISQFERLNLTLTGNWTFVLAQTTFPPPSPVGQTPKRHSSRHRRDETHITEK